MKQIYLPYDEYNEILKKLSVRARVLYLDILNLSQKNSHCIASDTFFCKQYKICRQTLWRALRLLKNHSLIETGREKNNYGRKIRTIKPLLYPQEKHQTNTSRNSTYQYIKICDYDTNENMNKYNTCASVHTYDCENENIGKTTDKDFGRKEELCTINGTETFMVHSTENGTKFMTKTVPLTSDTKMVQCTENGTLKKDTDLGTENGTEKGLSVSYGIPVGHYDNSKSGKIFSRKKTDDVAILQQQCCNFATNNVAFLQQQRCNFATQDKIINNKRKNSERSVRGRTMTSVDLVDENGRSIVLPNPYKEKEDGYHG